MEINKIYLGDSFEMDSLIDANSIDLILEDMPYNMTACKWETEIDLNKYWKSRLRILKSTGAVILTASQPFTSKLVMSNYKMFKYEWIWEKNIGSNFSTAKYQPIKEHENILVFYNKKRYNPILENRMQGGKDRIKSRIGLMRGNDNGVYGNGMNKSEYKMYGEKRLPRSIQKFNVERGYHPTQKPIKLFEYLIMTYTNINDFVFDGFAGSGTTAIASINCDRNYICIEKERKYFEIAKKRIEDTQSQMKLNFCIEQHI